MSDDFTRAVLIEAGNKFSIKHPAAVIDEVEEVFAGWGTLAKQYGVTREQIIEVSKKHRIGLKLK